MECGCEKQIIPRPIAKCFVLTKVADSIACQEHALCCILNAECDKLKKVICTSEDIANIIAVNNSVAAMLAQMTEFETVLKDKLASVLPYLCNAAETED